jgi:hypothetical protein
MIEHTNKGSRLFNTIRVYFLHLCSGSTLHDGYTLTSMDVVLVNTVAIEISHTFDWISLPIELNLVALHNLLDGSTHVTQPHINTCLLDTSICGFSHSLQKILISWIECNCERTINQVAINVSPKIYFAHVIILENSIVTIVRGVVSGTVVNTASCGESLTCLETIRLNNVLQSRLKFLAHINHLDSWAYYSLRVLPHLSMNLRSLPQ